MRGSRPRPPKCRYLLRGRDPRQVVLSFTGISLYRPSYTNQATPPITLKWLTIPVPIWILIADAGPYYQTITLTNWCYELLQAAWRLGTHPDTTYPLPLLESSLGPDRPTTTTPLTEGQVDPAHILDPTPTFAWSYIPADGGPPQNAYQIHVASSRLLLDAHQPDLWDSGIVESAAHQTIYAGDRLRDLQMYFWAVRVRDTSGIWSEDWY